MKDSSDTVDEINGDLLDGADDYGNKSDKPNLAEALRYAASKKLYNHSTEKEEGIEGEEEGEKGSLLGKKQYSIFTDPQDLHVSHAVVAYFNFHYAMCLIMFGNALVALPALLVFMTQGLDTGMWGWTTYGNIGEGNFQPYYVGLVDVLYFGGLLTYLTWRFQHQHLKMQTIWLERPPKASDYTIIVAIPVILTDPTQLISHFSKWGEISSIVVPLDHKEAAKDGSDFIPSIGQAFVTFTYHRCAIQCLNDCNRNLMSGWVWRYLCSLGLPGKFNIDKCRVRIAPEPSDLQFENLRYSDLFKAAMFILGALCIIIILILNFVALYFMLDYEFDVLSKRSGLVNTIVLLAFSRWMALLNYGMKRVSFLYVDQMKVSTKTAQAFLKLAVTVSYQVFNGGVLLLVANFFIYDRSDVFTPEWYVNSAQNVILLVLANPIVSFLTSVVKPEYLFRSKILSRKAKTQEALNKYLSPPDFSLSEVYSMLLVTAFITFMFSNGFPILPIVTCILFFAKYWLEKYNLLRCCARPPEVSMWPFSFISVETLLLGITAHSGLGALINFLETARLASSTYNLGKAMASLGINVIPFTYVFVIVFLNTPFRYLYLLKNFLRSRLYVPKHLFTPYGKVSLVESYILPNSHSSDFQAKGPSDIQSNEFCKFWINPDPCQSDAIRYPPALPPARVDFSVSVSK